MRLSIIIPTKDRPYKIKRLLDQLYDNKFFFNEIILIDSSNINNKKKLTIIIKKIDSNIKLINSRPSISLQRNKGLKNMKILKIILVIVIFDFVASNLLFKKMDFWEYDKLTNHYWRVPSKIYHHGLLPNINVVEPWGWELEKKLITNSLGFRDFTNKKVSKKSKKKRLLLIGDSAIEGAGYDYEFTLGGLLQNHLINKYEVINSAIASYSPSIYFKKIEHFINEGYIFDKAIIFLDPSDIIDELFIRYDENDNILIDQKNVNKKKYFKGF